MFANLLVIDGEEKRDIELGEMDLGGFLLKMAGYLLRWVFINGFVL